MSLELFFNVSFKSSTVCKGSRRMQFEMTIICEWLLIRTKPYNLDTREQQVRHSAIMLP